MGRMRAGGRYFRFGPVRDVSAGMGDNVKRRKSVYE
jgi:hypothetical protein